MTTSETGMREQGTAGADPDAPRTVWITGAGSGMGRATALRAARSGWTVALSGRRREEIGRAHV